MSRSFSLIALAVLVLACTSKEKEEVAKVGSAKNDSVFAALQKRGAMVMGVDQYTSAHRFEPLADGGRIVLQRDSVDGTGEVTIRAHMKTIAAAFSAGDFTSPEYVHATDSAPGTAVMARLKNEITYSALDLPRGGQVRIVTRNPVAVKAIHEYLAFQRMDHHAGM
jgi:aminoglycoside N3'-acetyltransferase